MPTAEEHFHRIAASIPGAKEGKMFGALAIQAPNGKAGVLLKHGEMAFKLAPDDLAEAMSLAGATHFDPSGGRPMKGWAQVPAEHAAKWEELARRAIEFVAG